MKSIGLRMISTSACNSQHFKLLIAGGGTGGASTAHKFANKLGKEIAVIEPADVCFVLYY